MLFLKKLLNKFLPKQDPLDTSTRVLNYIWYALGEVLLIVIGILLAVNINAYSKRLDDERAFNKEVEQIYNELIDLSFEIEGYNNGIYQQIYLIDSLLNDEFSYDHALLPPLYYYLDTPHIFTGQFDINFQDNVAKLNPITVKQKRITTQIFDYIESSALYLLASEQSSLHKGVIFDYVMDKGIPVAYVQLGFHGLNDLDNLRLLNSYYEYTENEIRIAKQLMTDPVFINKLKSLKLKKGFILFKTEEIMRGTTTVIEQIEQNFVSIKQYLPNIGIIGDAIKGRTWHDDSVDMTLIDPVKKQWHVRLELNDGEVKFRADNLWKRDWGGVTFPKGRLMYRGDNISVEEGVYDIYFDLSKGLYRFEPADTQ